MTRERLPPSPARALLVAFLLAAPALLRAQEPTPADELPLEDVNQLVPAPEPVVATQVDDDHVWEDVSYGTGEADFTAAAVDPENPRRLWAGAAGAVFVSDDGGLSWTRVLEVRGGYSRGALGDDSARAQDAAAESEFDDRFEELKEEALEEAKREIMDELIAEFGDSGEKLAEELAEELAEQRIEEDEDRLREEARQDIRKRAQRNQDSTHESAPATEPRRIHRILPLPGGRVLVATGSGLYLSKDRGASFDQLKVGLAPEDLDVRAVAAHPLVPNALYAGTLLGLYTSTDGGDTWSPVGDLPPRTAVHDIAIDPSQPAIVLAGSDQGVFRSTDSGRSFVPVLQPTLQSGLRVKAVAFDPTDARIAFAGTDEGLYRALDGGFAWERLEPPGLLSREVTDLASVEWGLVVGTVNGVYLSADQGASFRELYAGLDEKEVRRLAGGATPLELWAATGRGIFAYRPPKERARRLKALAEIRDVLTKEPPVADVAKAALTAAHMDETPAGMMSRAQLAPFAPRLTVKWGALNPLGDPFTARTLFPDPVPGQPDPDPLLYDLRRHTDNWQVLFLWDATRFVFNTDTLEASRTMRMMEKVRERVLRRVVNAYDARRRLQIALIQSPPSDVRGLAFKTIQVEELTGVLDGLTNGYFTAALAAGARTAPAPGEARKR